MCIFQYPTVHGNDKKRVSSASVIINRSAFSYSIAESGLPAKHTSGTYGVNLSPQHQVAGDAVLENMTSGRFSFL